MKLYHTLLASSISLGLGLYLGNFQKNYTNLGFAVSGIFAGSAAVTSIANSKIDRLKTDLERLQNSIKDLEVNNSNLKLKLSTSNGDLKSVTATVQNLKQTNAQLSLEVNNLKGDKNTLTTTNNDLNQRVKELTVKVEKLSLQCLEQEEELNQHAKDFDEKLRI